VVNSRVAGAARGAPLCPSRPGRLRLQGFIVSDHADAQADFVADLSRWVADGKLRWRETTLEGIENAPRALLSLFEGGNVGKMLVKLA
jgi:NADPH-dependent curcumin reductase CurA